MLYIYFRYHIEFSVPWNTCIHLEGKPAAPVAMLAGNYNANCHIVDFALEKDGLRYKIRRVTFLIIGALLSSQAEVIYRSVRLKVELLAYKEKILKDDVEIMCCSEGTPLKIVLNARVLGKDKGTPLLRNGIRSIAVEGTNEDEISE